MHIRTSHSYLALLAAVLFVATPYISADALSADAVAQTNPNKVTVAPSKADAQASSSERTQVVIETNFGEVIIELFDKKSPISVQNFLSYVDAGHYDGTIFHRVIPKFMIQGGGFTDTMIEKPGGDPIKNESKNRIYNERGTIAMARLPDPHSASNQFYINVKMNRSLDFRLGEFGYAVFGKVIEGMHVVDNISVQETRGFMGHGDVPIEPVTIKQVRRVNKMAPTANED